MMHEIKTLSPKAFKIYIQNVCDGSLKLAPGNLKVLSCSATYIMNYCVSVLLGHLCYKRF